MSIMNEPITGLTQLKQKTSLTDQIHDRILEMIIENSSSEEQMILNEKRLTEFYGVSKAPVREALIRLCSEGVLINVPRFGYMVVQMSLQDYQDINAMRIMLETEALRLAFPNIGKKQLEEIKNQITRAEAKQDVDVWQVWEDNEEFHLLLASYAGNKILTKFLTQCMSMEKRLYAQNVWNVKSSMEDSVVRGAHASIYDRLCERDLEGTIVELTRDIDVGRREEESQLIKEKKAIG